MHSLPYGRLVLLPYRTIAKKEVYVLSLSRSAILELGAKKYQYYPVSQIEGVEKLPYSLIVLLENVLRCAESDEEAQSTASTIIKAAQQGSTGEEIAYSPARVLLQDFTGVPVFVDFAVMREAMAALGGNCSQVNPQIPCDLVIDHSVIADEAGCEGALEANMEMEFKRNKERYTFLKWAQSSFENVRIVPPGAGICHQINVEEFSRVAMTKESPEGDLVYFDTVVGTDSHTTTANGIGVLSWGVGGIEAEAAALGQPITTLVPRVVGVELIGELSDGVTAMDLALNFAQILRATGVVGSFVECFGPGLASLSAAQRVCIANMTPEYGSTCTLFPVDDITLDYLRLTGRSDEQVELVEAYAKAQGFWHAPQEKDKQYAETIKLNLSEIQPSLSGPSRPHDRLDWRDSKQVFQSICEARGLDRGERFDIEIEGQEYSLSHGALALAAVTSCTTATDPAMMIASGLVAQNAVDAGLSAKPWVKRVFAPGSHATELLLEHAGLGDALRKLGFYNCGFGCMSCIGNSGPIAPALHDIAGSCELASVLSGNRNFEGRISPDVSQNYLASPAAVVVYSLVGTMDFDFENEPLGKNAQGEDVYLKDIWPSKEDIEGRLAQHLSPELYKEGKTGLYEGTQAWKDIEVDASEVFTWDEASSYVREAPYFQGMGIEPAPLKPIERARALVNLGDFITTDHISPAGSIAADSPAADYLRMHGVSEDFFNTYGARRGNHEVMMRGTFANVKLQNKLAEGKMGCWTYDFTQKRLTSVFDAAESYRHEGTPLVVLAGKMYGSGSSRDWAAKGPALLGVSAVLAESYERIHRSNLIGMGVLPLQFEEGSSVDVLGLDGTELFTIGDIDFSQGLPNPVKVMVSAVSDDRKEKVFPMIVRIDTPTEGHYYAHGGILHYVLRNLAKG